ncbi:TetR/AcrR family transcriptional regulator [Micromonospora siamensis]|uniref:DNA-binding transcriptional regulator, AcrR family n=1 Tax=Micromonospora siamensis TaxID=299152 RepID=A0A1C5I6J9_9ACTN|nr:TetR family transcriptional regulator [Micromonospora siamensis]SCG53785.1 DNA-binding transcriptional regulator, AcrR family [Micromonospora siamensis]
MSGGRRGRRPGGGDSREVIAAAARRQFAAQGYPRTSIRSVAAEAGVDPRLVQHFFGSKQELFVSVVELPFDPAEAFEGILGPGVEGLGERLAAFVIGTLTGPEVSVLTGMIRAATSEEQAAAMVRELVSTRLLGPLAARVSADRPELRASLLAAQVVGLQMARNVVGLPALVEADHDELVAALGPLFQHLLTGDLGTPAQAGDRPRAGYGEPASTDLGAKAPGRRGASTALATPAAPNPRTPTAGHP